MPLVESLFKRLPVRRQKRFPAPDPDSEPQTKVESVQETVGQQKEPKSSGSKAKTRDLWQEAYESILGDSTKSDLFKAYAKFVLNQGKSDLVSSSNDAPLGISHPYVDPLQNPNGANAVKRALDASTIAAEKAVRKSSALSKTSKAALRGTVKNINAAKDFIGYATSFEPHAALAWAGLSLLLPFLLNPCTQREASLTGIEYISALMIRYSAQEQTYRTGDVDKIDIPNGSDEKLYDVLLLWEKHAKALYSLILEYQMRMICAFARSSITQYFRDVVLRDNWPQLLYEIKQSEDHSLKASGVIDGVRLVDGFTRVMTRQKEAEDARIQEGIFHALFRAYEGAKKLPRNPVKGTCDWFLLKDQWMDWHSSSSNSLLLVTAGAGCGKSVLMKYLVNSCIQGEVYYYFFKDSAKEPFNAADALCAILHQLFRTHRELLINAVESWEYEGQSLGKDLDSAWDILVACAKQHGKPIICIIDALNEAADDQLQVFLERIKCHTRDPNSPGVLKFIISARTPTKRHTHIRNLIQNLPGSHLEFDQKPFPNGWNSVVRSLVNELEKKMGLRNSSLMDRLEMVLLDHQKLDKTEPPVFTRTFLWLDLILRDVECNYRLNRLADSDLSIRNFSVVDFTSDMAFPSSVEDAWDRLLSWCNDLKAAGQIFSLILGAQNPLLLDELAAANAALEGNFCNLPYRIDEDEASVKQARVDFGRDLEARCALFITIIDLRVYLVHQSAKEFLLGTRGQARWANAGLEKVPPPSDSGSELLLACIRWLSSLPMYEKQLHRETVVSRLDSSSVAQTVSICHPFTAYAACNWQKLFLHAYKASNEKHRNWFEFYKRQCSSEGRSLWSLGEDKEMITNLCNLSNPLFWRWFLVLFHGSHPDPVNAKPRDRHRFLVDLVWRDQHTQVQAKLLEFLGFTARGMHAKKSRPMKYPDPPGSDTHPILYHISGRTDFIEDFICPDDSEFLEMIRSGRVRLKIPEHHELDWKQLDPNEEA